MADAGLGGLGEVVLQLLNHVQHDVLATEQIPALQHLGRGGRGGGGCDAMAECKMEAKSSVHMHTVTRTDVRTQYTTYIPKFLNTSLHLYTCTQAPILYHPAHKFL